MNGTEKYDDMYDPNLISKLEELKNKDLDAFSTLIFRVILENEDLAINDNSPVEKKIRALNNLMEYFKSIEKYEECAFIRDLIGKIENGQ